MKDLSPEREWNRIVRDNTIHVRGGEYVSLKVIESLKRLFLSKHGTIRSGEIDKWVEESKGIAEVMLQIADIMEATKDSIYKKMAAEYEEELHQSPKK